MSFDELVAGGVNPTEKTYQSDLIRAAYNAPNDGGRMEFRYRTALRKNTEKRLGANTYVGVDGTEYQELGNDGGKYEMEGFFSGPNHPADARAFEALLLLPTTRGNPGRLEHPREKIIDVVVPSVGLVDDPNKDAAQTKVRMTMFEQLTLPNDIKDRPELAVQYQLDEFNLAAADDFGSAIVYDSPLTDNVAFSPTFGTITDSIATAREAVSAVNVITETMGTIIGKQASALENFNAIKTDIFNNIDTLVEAPFVLAAGMNRLVQFALDLPGDFLDKAQGWAAMYKRILGTDDENDATLSGGEPDSVTSNRANVQSLVASSASASMMVNAVAAADSYLTKQAAYDSTTSAMATVKEIVRSLEAVQAVYAGTVFQRQFFGLPSTLGKLNSLSRLCYASMQQFTANLPATRIITLHSDTQMLQVCWDYYRSVARERLDAFTESNSLTINEMVVIPKGRTLYV